jgi:hypothetical protein
VDLGHGNQKPADFTGGEGSAAFGKDFNRISRLHRAALKNPNKYPFPGHDTVAGQSVNGAPVVADLADLGHLDQRFGTYPQAGPYGQGRQIQAFGGKVFGERPGSNLQTQILHLLDALHGQQADLTVPGSPMGITRQSKILQQQTLGDILLGDPFLLADGNSHDSH